MCMSQCVKYFDSGSGDVRLRIVKVFTRQEV